MIYFYNLFLRQNKFMDKFQNNIADQIFCGDCKEIMRRLQDNSVDLVVTDPPYLVNYRSRDGRSIANDDNNEWIMPTFSQIWPKPNIRDTNRNKD